MMFFVVFLKKLSVDENQWKFRKTKKSLMLYLRKILVFYIFYYTFEDLDI